MEPDKKLLKKVEVDMASIKGASVFREEAPTHKDHKAKSSDKKVKKLNKG